MPEAGVLVPMPAEHTLRSSETLSPMRSMPLSLSRSKDSGSRACIAQALLD